MLLITLLLWEIGYWWKVCVFWLFWCFILMCICVCVCVCFFSRIKDWQSKKETLWTLRSWDFMCIIKRILYVFTQACGLVHCLLSSVLFWTLDPGAKWVLKGIFVWYLLPSLKKKSHIYIKSWEANEKHQKKWGGSIILLRIEEEKLPIHIWCLKIHTANKYI